MLSTTCPAGTSDLNSVFARQPSSPLPRWRALSVDCSPQRSPRWTASVAKRAGHGSSLSKVSRLCSLVASVGGWSSIGLILLDS